ncbi:MAG: hypothetical protein M1840_005435 [Geoglossum simile]|nr:MAG: hypothetical protein M1840_005435 [Geoglossum simile]
MVRLGLPTRLKGSRSNSRTPSRSTSPKSMEDSKSSTLVLKTTATRVRITQAFIHWGSLANIYLGWMQARNLAAMDRGGTSDPYLVVSLGDCRFVTHAVNKTLNPEWNVSFDFPLNGSSISIIECVCWDKDRFGKDYLGEFKVPLDEIFIHGRAVEEPKWFPLVSKRKGSKISGEVELQFTLLDSANPSATPEDIHREFQALLSGTPTTPSNEDYDALDREGAGYVDDEDDDENEEEISDETDDPTKPETAEKRRRRLRLKSLKKKKKASPYELSSNVLGVVFLEVSRITDLPPERNMTRTGFDMDPFVIVSLGKKTYRTRVIRHNLNPVFDEKMIFQVMRQEQNYSMSFSVVDRDKLSGNDFVAQCSLALQDIISTAPEADAETGLYRLPEPQDMPNLSPQSSRSRFKLPLSRSSSASSLTKLARPGLQPRGATTSQSYTGSQVESTLLTPPIYTGVPDLTGQSPIPPVKVTDDNQSPNQEGDSDLKPFTIPLLLKNKDRWEAKHSPELKVKAKYLPYPALRQQFWRALLKQYDADDSGRISKVELTTMLDTLGSTLKESTIDGFFKRYAAENEDPSCMELTFDQTVICLEDQLDQSSQKRSLGESITAHLPKVPGLPAVLHRDDSGDSHHASASSSSGTPTINLSESSAVPTVSQDTLGSAGEEGDLLSKDDLVDEKGEEHVIEITECPICHQPRLNKRSDTDIITHIATCASQDWRQVNNIVMAGFVTSSQAQRKWYSKVITKISYGGYKLGANSANILVQDRITGQINEERMSVYVRLGIRLLYKGLKSREMEKKRIRKLLRSLSVKQGKKYDDPVSTREISSFIAFHQLDMSEVLLPLEQFKSFNEFFYRALKPGQRPCSAPDNPKIIVSPADCRSVVFNTIDDATKVWIKGREFSISRLLGKAYPEDAKRYVGGALGIFRLAPQDYHRFHIPVDGTLGTPQSIEGEYYTVNPMAIRSALDVYGENVRIICPINSVAHGRVMTICVGAMMVGSTVITAKEGQQVKRAEELGYFKFGGSTIILLFEPGTMKFDEDLVENSNTALETLIRVGMSIGHSPEQSAHTPDMRKENVTQEERQDAQRRIEGSLAPAPLHSMGQAT